MVTGRAVQVMGIGQAEARNVYWPGPAGTRNGTGRVGTRIGYWPGWGRTWIQTWLGQEMDIDRAGTGNVYNTIINISGRY